MLVYSKTAAVSPWVKGEVNIAFTEGKTILPYRIDETSLDGGLRVMLNQYHWIDSYPDYKMRFKDLLTSVKANLGQSEEYRHIPKPQPTTPKPTPTPAPKPNYLKYILGVLAVVLGIVLGVVLTNNEPAPKPTPGEEEVVAEVDVIPDRGIICDHEWVDLGLSVKWATCNVGANAPHGYGNYYAWGETSTKNSYDEDNSRTFGKSMSDISGNARYDAARDNWGRTWRLPTKREMEELESKCTWQWTTQSGVEGYKVTGPNGNSIFLPAAGFCYGSSPDRWDGGFYWSSTPYESNERCYAYGLYFGSGGHYVYRGLRDCGHAVRPVSE